MKTTTIHTTIRRLALCFALLAWSPAGNLSATLAADFSPSPGVTESENKSDAETRPTEKKYKRGGDFGSFFKGLQSPGVHEKNHDSIKSAFRDVVRQPRISTVEVLCDNERKAFGTIVSADGFILTKASELFGRIECRLSNKQSHRARIVGVLQELDLAMLKIEADQLTPIQWSEAETPVGSLVATPGIKSTPKAIGVVSVMSRKIASPHGVLGIWLENSENGARIERVISGSGAEKAGLKVNDVIQLFNGKLINARDALIEAVREFQPGDKVELKVLRGDKEILATATLGSIPSLSSSGNRIDFQNSLGGPLSERRAGFPKAIQHDTFLRPNDCGGPLVNLEGKTIAVNIARAGRVKSYAIPASVILPLLDSLKSGKGALTALAVDVKAPVKPAKVDMATAKAADQEAMK